MNYIILTNGSIQATSATGAVYNIPNDPNNSDYQAFLAWKAAGNTPGQQTAPVMTSEQARALGESYVEEFFTLMQMMELMELLQSSSTPADQLAKIQAIYTWLTTIKAAWLSNPQNFNPTTFGNPPYTYSDIASTTN